MLALNIKENLDKRYEMTMEEYEQLLINSNVVKFGTRNTELDTDFIPKARKALGKDTLFLKEIKEFHRVYEWIS